VIVIEPNCEQSPVFLSDWDQAVHRCLCLRHRFQTSWPKWVFDSQFWPFGPYSVYSILRRSFIRRGRINEPVLTEIKYKAATSFHGTADPDTKHVPLLSCSETASVATAPHTIPPPSTYHLLVRGPFPRTNHQLHQSCWRGLSVATNKIAAAVHTQLHGALPVADSVYTGVSEVVPLLKNTGVVVDFVGVSGEERGRAVERGFVVEDEVSIIAQEVDMVLENED